MAISPTLSAIMCDGMGWFEDVDYKRMLLTFDEVYYLLPKHLVAFRDSFGKKHTMYFPPERTGEFAFKMCHFVPDAKTRELIFSAAEFDLSIESFNSVIDTIPGLDRRYTWRVVNSDGDLGQGQSIELELGQEKLAHAILLNKFLLAAHSLGYIPITGKRYIHGLISEKYMYSVQKLRTNHPELVSSSLLKKAIKLNPIVDKIVSVLVPDDELEKRTEADIAKFKERNRKLFERYSYTTRKLVGEVSLLPLDSDFEAQVEELIQTEVWKEKREIEEELRSAWKAVFRSAIKGAAGALVGVGVSPFFSLGAITLASVVAASTAVAPWVVEELLKFIEAQEKIREHGLYYLMKFAG